MLSNKLRFRKGQTAEAMTWVVATIIILISTFLFLFFVSVLSKSKAGSSSFGIGFFSEEDSGVATQQMLFALLNSKDSNGREIKSLIQEGQYNEVRKNVENLLSNFKEEIKCNFFVEDLNRAGYLIKIDNQASGKKVSLEIGEKEVSLECSE